MQVCHHLRKFSYIVEFNNEIYGKTMDFNY